MQHFDSINSLRYIYLSGISEPMDNCLRFNIEEAISSDEEESFSVAGVEIGGLHSLDVTGDSRIFRVDFESYIAYVVLDESYALPREDEVGIGRLFRINEKSQFLRYVSQATFACDEHPGPFKHYSFCCLNHVVEVVSTDKPRIELISGG